MAAKKNAAKAAPQTQALTVSERAVVALGYNAQTQKQLTELAQKSQHITAITNDDGYKQVHSARMALKNTRLAIAKRGKAAREDATAFSKAVIAEEDHLIGLIQPEEHRLDLLQITHDEKIEAEKQAKIQAELDRVAALEARISALRGDPQISYQNDPEFIAAEIQRLDAIPVDDSFEDRQQQASDAKAAGILRLSIAYKDAVQRVADQKKRAEEQAELEQLRRDKADRDRREAEERAARAITPSQSMGITSDNARVSPPQSPEKAAPTAGGVTAPGVLPLAAVKSEDPPKYARRPTFTEIVDMVAFQYDVTPEVVRTWICSVAAQEAA